MREREGERESESEREREENARINIIVYECKHACMNVYMKANE